MATYRKVHTSFWQDPYVLTLTPERKFFYLYLMTNNRTSMAGVYEMPIQVVCVETGYNRETIEKLVYSFVADKKILFDAETGEVFLLNWLKHNYSESPKVLECIHKDAENIKSKTLYAYCIDTLYTHERNKTKTKKKTNTKHNMADFFDGDFLTYQPFIDAWEGWIDERDVRKKPMTERAMKMQANFLSNHSVQVAVQIIEQSIKNGWQGLFEIKDYKKEEPKPEEDRSEFLRRRQATLERCGDGC